MSGARTGGGEGEQLREIKVGGEVQAPPGATQWCGVAG